MRPPLDALEGEEALPGAAAEQVGHHLPNQPCDELPDLPSHQGLEFLFSHSSDSIT